MNTEAMAKIGCTPYDLHQLREPEVIFRETKEEGEEEPQRQFVLARQVYIESADIEKYGLTRGCNKCHHEPNYGPGRTSAGHSKVCRGRIVNEMSKTP